MSRPFSLEIARVRFAVEPPAGRRLAFSHSRYEEFVRERAPQAGRVEVAVELVLDEGPDVASLPLVFDTGSTWRAFGDAEDLLFEFRGEGGRRLWLARLDVHQARVLVHCGPFAEQAGSGDPRELASPLYYPLDQLLLMCLLPRHAGLIVHAAGLRRGDAAAIFPGHSGAGKSTLMGLVAGRRELQGLSDDRVVVRELDGVFRAFGTPWAGTGHVASADGAELRAMAFLHQAPSTRLERIGPQAALGQLLRTASIPWFHEDARERSLAVCERLLARVPTWELHFRKHEEVGEQVASLL